MLIRTPAPWQLNERDATPEATYLNRRQWMAGAGALGVGAALAACSGEAESRSSAAPGGPFDSTDPAALAPLRAAADPSPPDEALTDIEAATSYNNFYEFGLDKGDPKRNGHALNPRPWTVEVGGLAGKPQTFDIEALLKRKQEERVYRLRCVEAWSMVIPWIGFPLADILKAVEPQGSAKYVAFQTLLDKQQMPHQRTRALDWPYVEGLRLDEAMHPLTLLAVGMYGKVMPNQNGAPIRLVVPWKYGFKSIKSIVKITLTEREPPTTWNLMQPAEYGFYSNVNPKVDHPRWSQASERRIGEFRRRPTLMFNGYGDAVANLYAGMDLATHY